MKLWPFSRSRTDAAPADAPKLREGDRADGWFSALSGYGTSTDKRMHVSYSPDMMTDEFASQLWRGDDMSARVIETIPNEAFRQGFEINLGDKKLNEEIMAMLEALDALAVYKLVKNYERAYGGGAIWPIINDGQPNLALPLDEDKISEVSHLMVFEPRELQPSDYYTDPTKPKFSLPSTFSRGGTTGTTSMKIHETRLICFHGIRTSRRQISVNGWGDSVLARTYGVLRDFSIAWAATGVMLHDFAQAEFKIKGLADLMANDRDDVIKTRIKTIAMARSALNMVLMDSEESMERKQTPTSGLAELLDRFATRVAAACDMPVTLLMGQSPAGLNATGESDIRFFYDRVASIQKLGIQPQLERLVYLLTRALKGPAKGKEPEIWQVKFNPLWQPSEKEQAEIRKIVADTDAVNIGMGLYSGDEAALGHYGGDGFMLEMNVDFDARKKHNEALEKEDIARKAEQSAQGQSAALAAIVVQVNKQEISRESAIAILGFSYGMNEEAANSVLGPEDFEPVTPEPPPSPFGGEPSPPPDSDKAETEEDPPKDSEEDADEDP
jgi:phage-related protein (TIGR01555 family)